MCSRVCDVVACVCLVCACMSLCVHAHVCVVCAQGCMHVYLYMHMCKMVGMCIHTCMILLPCACRCTHMCMCVEGGAGSFLPVLLPKVLVQLLGNSTWGSSSRGFMRNLCPDMKREGVRDIGAAGARGAAWAAVRRAKRRLPPLQFPHRTAEAAAPHPGRLSVSPACGPHPLQTPQMNRFDYQTNFILCSNEELLLCKCG